MEAIEKINKWYQTHCDGEWEHSQGVSIVSCDNPGWWVKIDLTGTELENKKFSEITEGVAEHGAEASSWIRCYIENNVFNGAGDPARLPQILACFVTWAEL